jgi:hypothetical protein
MGKVQAVKIKPLLLNCSPRSLVPFRRDNLVLEIFFFFFLSVLGFELKASCLLGSLSTLNSQPPTASFCFSYFLNRVFLLFCLGSRFSYPYLLSSWDNIYMPPCLGCSLRWGSYLLFAKGGLKL